MVLWYIHTTTKQQQPCLGIMNGTKDAVDNFSLANLELDTPAVVECRNATSVASMQLTATIQQHNDYLAEHVNKAYVQHCCEEIDQTFSLKKNKQLLALHHRGAPMKPAQLATFRALQQQHLAVWEYRSGTELRAASNVDIADYVKQCTDFEAQAKTQKTLLDSASSNLKKAKTDQKFTPLRSAMDEMFKSFGCDMSQSYTLQWNGHACRKALNNANAITLALYDIWDDAAPRIEPDALKLTDLHKKCSAFLTKMDALWEIYGMFL
jgi:hypothetical protein